MSLETFRLSLLIIHLCEQHQRGGDHKKLVLFFVNSFQSVKKICQTNAPILAQPLGFTEVRESDFFSLLVE